MNLRIGLSALQASQFAINNISHNLANATTEGYHRQEVLLQTNQADFINGRYVGSGVEVNDVRRIRDMVVESSFTNVTSDLSRIEQGLLIESTIESLIAPGEGSIQNAFTQMFDGFSRLSANPGNTTLRNSIVNDASNLATRIQQVRGQLVQLRRDVTEQIELEVESLNQDIETLVDLQNRIKTAANNDIPNDLLDQRDQLINRIAERVDVQRYEFVQSELGLGLAGSSVSIGAAPIRFEVAKGEDGSVAIQIEGGNNPTEFAGGRIAALVEVNNQLIGDFENRIDTFASALINQFNQHHATGLGIDGPFALLQSSLHVEDANAALAGNSAFPISNGELSITVTDPSGELRTTTLAIDPETDSLNSVAAKISSVDNLQAVVDPNTGKMSVIAQPGFHFDFTGRLETIPDQSNITGTSLSRIAGVYTGEANEVFQVTALTGGTVGRTNGLTIQLADGNGTVLKEFDIGHEYEAGSPIELGNGVTIEFGIGDIVAGDSFEVKTVANSDTSGFLSALGLNNFFSGTDSTSIGVEQRIVDSSGNVATSRSGQIADTRNLEGLLALRDLSTVGERNQTFEDFFSEANSEIGFRVQSSQSIQIGLSDLKFEYQTKRDTVSGVDVNEELVNLTQHQKTYEAAIQVVRTMESMLDELFQIIR